jgi:hypothetical protein
VLRPRLKRAEDGRQVASVTSREVNGADVGQAVEHELHAEHGQPPDQPPPSLPSPEIMAASNTRQPPKPSPENLARCRGVPASDSYDRCPAGTDGALVVGRWGSARRGGSPHRRRAGIGVATRLASTTIDAAVRLLPAPPEDAQCE